MTHERARPRKATATLAALALLVPAAAASGWSMVGYGDSLTSKSLNWCSASIDPPNTCEARGLSGETTVAGVERLLADLEAGAIPEATDYVVLAWGANDLRRGNWDATSQIIDPLRTAAAALVAAGHVPVFWTPNPQFELDPPPFVIDALVDDRISQVVAPGIRALRDEFGRAPIADHYAAYSALGEAEMSLLYVDHVHQNEAGYDFMAATVQTATVRHFVGANLLRNPEFDTGISPAAWDTLADESSWSPLDVDASPDSGSAVVRETTQAETGRLEQPVPVEGSREYGFAGCGRIPSGQTAEGSFDIGIHWYADPCPAPGGFLAFDTLGVISGPVDSWECRASTLVAPDGARCAIATLALHNDAGTGALEVHFDSIALPEPGPELGLAAAAMTVGLLARWRRRGSLPRRRRVTPAKAAPARDRSAASGSRPRSGDRSRRAPRPPAAA